MQFFILGNPENRRVIHFSESLITSGYDKPIVLSYPDILKHNLLEHIDFSDSIVRIESPGENFEVRKLLISKGAYNPELAVNFGITASDALNLQERAGELMHTRQWYLGFKTLLNDIREKTEKYPTCKLMNDADDIALMFDKGACQAFLKSHHIPVPEFYTSVTTYDELLKLMALKKLNKVFIKPRHASSASGVIAFRIFGEKQQAITTIELKREGTTIRFFNSLKLKTYTNKEDIRIIIDEILKEHALVEKWLDKATITNHFFDLRVLAIKGKARHTIVRMSQNIITNLHLGNKRGNPEDLKHELEEATLKKIESIAEQTAACFPKSLYCGIDLLIGSNKKDVSVLEVNAFGDLLPNILHQNQNCYEAEIKAMLN